MIATEIAPNDVQQWLNGLSYDAVQFRLMQDVLARQFHKYGYFYMKSPNSNNWYVKSIDGLTREKLDSFADVLKFLFKLMEHEQS